MHALENAMLAMNLKTNFYTFNHYQVVDTAQRKALCPQGLFVIVMACIRNECRRCFIRISGTGYTVFSYRLQSLRHHFPAANISV